ncbi:hypothetical protein Cgig2_030940 [Carnegiea gigantea]|uniref:Uncharacterized protein n=1 Tax=Carnegiea gigantea TaxID=171969 RepID=A0A9Q1GJT3_9CARY|nr:hypothetical protein Cgig2_030940 [Carnegiea gigantea]
MDQGLFPNFANTEQATEYVRDHFRWSLRDPTDLGPRPLPSDYHGLCPHDAAELGLARRLIMDCVMLAMPKLDWGPIEAWLKDNDQRLLRAQASHPADYPANLMLAGGPSRGRTSSFPSFPDTAQAVEYVRGNLRWSKRETSSFRPNLLPWNFPAYCPVFDHIVAMQFAHAAQIPEMVQAVFFAMAINDAARLRLIMRETGGTLMSNLRKLKWDVTEAWLLFIEDKFKDSQL